MRGRFFLLLLLGLGSACSANESTNPGERCGQGEVCAASGICYRGFCIVDLQSGAGPDAPGVVSAVDSGSRLDDGGLSVDGTHNGSPDLDASGAEVSADAEAPSVAAGEDAGPTPPTGVPDAALASGAADGAVPAVQTPLPSDGNRRSVCYSDKPCAKNFFCAAPVGGMSYPGFCTDGCRTDANCPVLDGIAQVCSADGQCHVACGGAQSKGDGACPTNQVCRDVRGSVLEAASWYCTYPDNSGSRASLIYGACSTAHGNADCAGDNFCHQAEASALMLPTPAGTAGYCTGACTAAKDCAVPAGTTAVPLCTGARCEFDCAASGANTCPATMNCRILSNNPLSSAFRCVLVE